MIDCNPKINNDMFMNKQSDDLMKDIYKKSIAKTDDDMKKLDTTPKMDRYTELDMWLKEQGARVQ